MDYKVISIEEERYLPQGMQNILTIIVQNIEQPSDM